ncbi:MAG: hypothetical protein E6J91_35465 [Deltaproteobacteria bacterium]|nr:MAG: hypothetical protein E6J91_35465 [Deltaproteobacteria bacterium]
MASARAVEARLRNVTHAAAATELTAGDAPVQHWIVHPGIAFRARFDKFLDFVRPWWVAHYTHRLEVDAGEHYQDVVDGMAWVVDVTETAKRGALVHDLAGIAREALGDGPFLVFRNRGAERTLRGLDPHGLRGLPHMRTEASIDLGRDTFDAGDLLVFCATRLPPPSTRAIAEFGETFEVDVAFNDLLYSAFLDTAAVENQFGAVDWTELMTLYASWRVQVRVLPFTVQRPVWDDLLGDTVTAEIQKREGATRPFTRRLRAAAPDLDLLPGEVADRVRAWASDAPAAQVGTAQWQQGDRGISATPLIDDLAARLLAVRFTADLRAEAADLAHIVLDLHDSLIWGADRLNAFEKFFLSWRTERPKPMMEVLFAELDRRGAFTRLFEIIYDNYELWGWMRVALIGNVTGTSFQFRPEVQRLVAKMNAIIQDVFFQITWDPATRDLMFVHGGEHVRPAGENNPDPAAGVIGAVSDYFTQKGVVSRPNKATMERLAEPTRRKVQDLMLAMLCKPGESRTREELIGEAVNAAAAELKLDPEKDFDRVKVTFSYRVISVAIQTEHGVAAPYVTVEPVQRFSDGNWETNGPRKTIPLGELDAELMSIQVQHEMQALTIFMMAEMLVLGGAYIVFTATAVWVGALELAIAISIRELIYYWTTPEADRDLEGYLTQALFACVDVIGFRIGAGLAKSLGIKLAGRAITAGTLAKVSTRAILFVSKGLAMSATLGATQVVEKFADDLLHLTHCRRWSSPLAYLEEFGKGFAVGMLCEFAIAPVLSVGGRAAIRALANRFGLGAGEAAEELAKLVPADKIEGLLTEGADRLEPALANTLKAEKAGVVKQVMDAFRKQIRDIVEHVKALPETKGFFPRLADEYNARAIDDLFQAVEGATKGETKLGKAAKDALERLVRTTGTKEMNEIIQTLLESARMRGFLEAYPELATELFNGVYREAPAELDRLLAKLDGTAELDAILGALRKLPSLPAAELATITRLSEQSRQALARFLARSEAAEVRALIGWFGRTPTLETRTVGELLDLATSHPGKLPPVLGALDAQLAAGHKIRPDVLGGLFDARIRLDAFGADHAGAAVFLDDVAQLGEPERLFVLRNSAGKTPLEVRRFLAEERGALKRGAENLSPSQAKLREDIERGRQGTVRNELKATFRRPTPYEFTINSTVLRKNAQELERMGKDMSGVSPDAIIGEERGGPWLADAATSDNPGLAGRIVRLPNEPGQLGAQIRGYVKQRMDAALAADPNAKLTFAAVETYLSGSARNEMLKALDGAAKDYPQCEFHLFWVRESRGFEQVVEGQVGLTAPTARRGLAPNITEHKYEVPFIVGEDASRILDTASRTTEPVYIFDDLGQVVEAVQPKPGESPRQLVLRLLREWRSR